MTLEYRGVVLEVGTVARVTETPVRDETGRLLYTAVTVITHPTKSEQVPRDPT